ncbi:Gfo/Idh/MocA family oxidoreductase [Paludicola sp. MB14-C6]|uniref:Gfo/Idh/MocA family protein n=1 Tax=Paludihabitans sp. MB14-C6 TaxID=3070656 RepID=UPI0027DC16F2|nr:Gfo/Idh/MocA family oxidoreductase [Paludicola sp. MB14-C6]WMJ22840.1 Gfo/Idh/MocA family oxidoreductase [Paludicola sp. MB14-C6]
MNKVRIGIIGIGDISGIYLKNITELYKELELYAVCDLIKEKALKAKDANPDVIIYDTMDEVFADENVDIVLNLTRPYEHYGVSKAALLAGKHVYSEKPLAATLEEGKELVAIAKEKNLLLGGAPDTFMGAGIQTCRKLIDDGFIGTPIGAATFMICHGHESWHPDPAFYYKHGGGPMMDMGPYYITALVNLLGRISSTMSVAKANFKTRTITSAPHFGETVDVEVPTHVNGILNFESGAVGTIFTTFDVYSDSQARFEIYGTEGTLIVPDPNCFDGSIKLLKPQDGTYKEIPLCFNYSQNSRALGLADMAKALQTNRPFRANCEQTFHVLEVMQSLQKGGTTTIESPFNRKAPMVANGITGVLD